ncbi:MAG: hypothetical protein ACRDV9_01840, partial [Acidimicrobiia bacterium]
MSGESQPVRLPRLSLKPGAFSYLLVGVRRRLRLAWAVATLVRLAPGLGLAALALVFSGRLFPLPWTDAAALTLVALSLAAVVLQAALLTIPLLVAARAGDRGLATGDVFATAVEIAGGRLPESPLTARVQTRAEALATGRNPKEAVRLVVPSRRLTASGVALALALALALVPSAQDDARRRRAAEAGMAATEAGQVRQAAERVRQAGGIPADLVAKRLERLARDLERTDSLEGAKQAIDRTARQLGRELTPNFLAEKAALRGLERSLESRPLVGSAGASADQQMRELLGSLNRLSAEEIAQMAQRLAALASAQAAGNPRLAQALGEAAAALRGGDRGEAAGALSTAASAAMNAADGVAQGEAAAEAIGELAASRERLDGGAGGEGGSRSDAEGANAAGRGAGARSDRNPDGDAQGANPGAGSRSGRQGAGQGQSPGQGGNRQGGNQGASGAGQGTNAPGGQGGTGRRSRVGGSGENASVGLQRAMVYDPIAEGQGDQVGLGGIAGAGPDRVVGRGQGPTRSGAVRVPLERALPRYRTEATRALQALDIPPSMRALVRAYFESLS